VAITNAELAVRLGVYLFVLVGAPGFFILMFRLMDYGAKQTLVEQFSGQRNGRDTGQLNAYFEQAAIEATTCTICGAANGPDYNYCHNCQERLTG
jgi:ribosomal protein L40E